MTRPWLAVERAIRHPGDGDSAKTIEEFDFVMSMLKWSIRPDGEALLIQRPDRPQYRVTPRSCTCPAWKMCVHRRAFDLIQRYSEVQ